MVVVELTYLQAEVQARLGELPSGTCKANLSWRVQFGGKQINGPMDPWETEQTALIGPLDWVQRTLVQLFRRLPLSSNGDLTRLPGSNVQLHLKAGACMLVLVLAYQRGVQQTCHS